MTPELRTWIVNKVKARKNITKEEYDTLLKLSLEEQFYILRVSDWYDLRVGNLLKHWNGKMKSQAKHYFYLSEDAEKLMRIAKQELKETA